VLNAPTHWYNNQLGDHVTCHAKSPCRANNPTNPFFTGVTDSEDLKKLVLDNKERKDLSKYLKSVVTPTIAGEVCYGLFTSYLESFHRTILVYAPKTHNFSFSYELRIALATLDWNEHHSRAVLRTKMRSPKLKNRSHGYVRHIKGPKSNNFRIWIIHYCIHHESRPKTWNTPYQSCLQRANQIRKNHPLQTPHSIFQQTLSRTRSVLVETPVKSHLSPGTPPKSQQTRSRFASAKEENPLKIVVSIIAVLVVNRDNFVCLCVYVIT
jgi:hypothetical protein